MNSIKCPSCGLTNWAESPACKRCGGPIASEQTRSDPDQYFESSSSFSKRDHGNLQSGLAITSMVLGIAGLVTSFFLIGLLMVPFALIFGIIALVKAKRQPVQFGGKGFAITGIVTSCVTVVFVVPLLAAIAIPNILAARRAAYESSAIMSMRKIIVAESNYIEMREQGECPDLKMLGKENMIERELASGSRNGYLFESTGTLASGCEVRATPVSKSMGLRSYYYSAMDNVIRANVKKGLPADQSDPPLSDISPYSR